MRRATAPALAALALVLAFALSAAGQTQDPVGARVAASAQAAEALEGPLDGEWTLANADGVALYDFQIVDQPGGESGLGAVWRDLRKPAVPGAIGVVDRLSYDGRAVSLGFTDETEPVTVRLRRSRGRWRGEMAKSGRLVAVVLRRG